MKTVLRYLKPFALLVILAVGLLSLQAVAELTQPNLMSDIVNVGLQNGGIVEDVPTGLTPRAMQMLTLFMTPEDAETFRDAYFTAPGVLDEYKLRNRGDDPSLAELYGRAVFFLVRKIDFTG
ncbi:MAG: hypothetical protein LBB75_06620, partial [Oscillospiraceae bacterium]|nr:hypothetical protein [Oscillospiraceae bacterium]